jgi:hypothetical protein
MNTATPPLHHSARLADKVAALQPRPRPQPQPRKKVVVPQPPADTSEQSAVEYERALLKIIVNMIKVQDVSEIIVNLFRFIRSRHELPYSIMYDMDVEDSPPVWKSKLINFSPLNSELMLWYFAKSNQIRAICHIEK